MLQKNATKKFLLYLILLSLINNFLSLFFSVLLAQRLFMATPAKRALDFDENKEVSASDVNKKTSVSGDVIKEVEVTPSDEKENVAQNHDDPVVIVDVKTELSSQPIEKLTKENSEEKASMESNDVSSHKVPEPKKSYKEKVVNGNTSPKTTSPKTSKTLSSTSSTTSSTTSTTMTSNKTSVSKEPVNGNHISSAKTTTALKTTAR
jgi:hypothetical protein